MATGNVYVFPENSNTQKYIECIQYPEICKIFKAEHLLQFLIGETNFDLNSIFLDVSVRI